MSQTASDFENLWPALARRLHAMLSAKRVPPHKRDDIVQETGLRLFGMWEHVDPQRSIWGLTVTIALNLLRDEARRHPEREVLGLVPERATESDVETVGLARLELRRVREAMAHLSPDHRSILLAELGDHEAPNGRGPNATKMLRMRARRRLTALLDVASASGWFLGLRLKRVLNLEQYALALRNLVTQSEGGLAATAAGVIAAMSLFSIPSGIGPSLQGTPGELDGKGHVRSSSSDLAGSGGSWLQQSGRDIALLRSETAAATKGEPSANPTRPPRNGKRIKPPAEDEYEPVHVPIGGDGYIEGGAQIHALGVTVEVGDRGSNPPVCVSHGKAEVMPNLQCEDRERPSSNAIFARAGLGGTHTGLSVRF